jgi:ATP adenylyltransferase
METLFTPWRFEYISSHDPDAACFLCAAVSRPEDPSSLVVHRSGQHLVVLNRHPYASGHLMVAPLAHLAAPAAASPEAKAEFWPLVLRCQEVLDRAYRPHGFNLGMNLGRSAGAGVPGHYHFHLVPRWEGDTNFMSVLGAVRLVPEEPAAARERLRPLFVAGGPA